MIEEVFIELGSNIDPEQNLPRAVGELARLGQIRSVSNAYQNPAIASEPQPDFINAAVLVETDLPPLELRERLRSIEAKLGRVRSADKYAPRTIDLDICLYGSMILMHPLLTVPDQHIYQRPHLAVTLAECNPDFLHPQTGEPLKTIAGRLHDPDLLTRRDDLDLTSKLEDAQRNSIS